ncbi:MAG TPA: hypothetical protein VHG89_03450 [Verrucomicrobiae bacterium]|nr:hypothetical protein [Verrucomicrobiae bacterium]
MLAFLMLKTQCMTKLWVQISLASLLFVSLVAKLRAAVESQVPLGYEDEKGFHFGVKQAANK